ncbi:unnamed protein product [Miscanthus lutarioriparius]|uniref:Uncharacterized protein n=1 Tax=Miscanthus lutarioriparius TaxID=422564 RepID=A0A811S173_9POAL|nr:unnamed protein product [Miscanthus lutarioriparius]
MDRAEHVASKMLRARIDQSHGATLASDGDHGGCIMARARAQYLGILLGNGSHCGGSTDTWRLVQVSVSSGTVGAHYASSQPISISGARWCNGRPDEGGGRRHPCGRRGWGALQQIKRRVGGGAVDVVVVGVLEMDVAVCAPHVDAEKGEAVHRAEDDRAHEWIQIVGGHVQNGGLRWVFQQKGYLDEHPVAVEGCGGGAVPVDANDGVDVE